MTHINSLDRRDFAFVRRWVTPLGFCAAEGGPQARERAMRIRTAFAAAAAENRAAFIPFIMAGDPDPMTSLALLKALPAAGADLIELGVCFTDPMADGPSIQAAGLRALASGQTLARTLAMVRAFRETDHATPIILMGYYNPFHAYGVDAFLADAKSAGVDGLIIVDLPPEEDAEMAVPAAAAGLDFIRLATPTTDAARLPAVISGASGFIYYVAVAGVTGQKSAGAADVSAAVARLKAATPLPVAVGFGVKTPEQARQIARVADAVVVGSALTDRVAAALSDGGGLEAGSDSTDNRGWRDAVVSQVLSLARDIAEATRAARKGV